MVSMIGKKAPDFSLSDQEGKVHALKDYKGKTIVLYFYPKDSTPGCTTEACDFRDSMARLQEKDVVVLGVSADSVDSHKKFASKYDLSFPLLADETKETIKAYGAFGLKKFMGKEFEGIIRTTVIIDAKGKIAHYISPVKVKGHVDEVLSLI
ncbi:MAG: thioredoxin-dependent thiol peroxidase [Candidatus Woesearchaeota archaeon]